ncbi:MAG: extracellular solute-binding protein [Alphaproteobacteria bacterium]|nr:extracellular solute-binding protein [Alphaproteobacteria bacterium]
MREAAKFGGGGITIAVEEGLRALDLLDHVGPLWRELTGINVRVVELPADQMFLRIMENHENQLGDFDVIDVSPTWMPDLVAEGALAPLDFEATGIARAFSSAWGDEFPNLAMPEDGDVLVLHYRRDIFEDRSTREAFRRRFGKDLEPPTNWHAFRQVAAFLTERYAPDLYGAAIAYDPACSEYLFRQRMVLTGGKFFDVARMRAAIAAPEAYGVLSAMVEDADTMPPGVRDWSGAELLHAWLSGHAAMVVAPPSFARWADGFDGDDALGWLPPSRISGKAGMAPLPGGRSVLAPGHALALSSSGRNQAAARLFLRWLTSAEISHERAKRAASVHDPVRNESIHPLAAVAIASAIPPMRVLAGDRYETALRLMLADVWKGVEPLGALERLGEEWNHITASVDPERQRALIAAWVARVARQ